MTAEIPHEPVPGFFPLDSDILEGRIRFADELTEAEQEALHAGNLASLALDDPFRYLLEGRARPDLPEGSRFDYNTGVCVGQAAVRRQMRARMAQGLPELSHSFDPASGPVYRLPAPSRHLPPGMNGIRSRMRTTAYIYTRVAAFVGEEDTQIAMRGLLRGKPAMHDMPFVSDKQLQAEHPDALMLGLGDAFALYHSLYGGTVNRTRIRHELVAPHEYIPRRKRRDSCPEAGVPQMELCDLGVGFLEHAHRMPGYRAVLQADAPEGARAGQVLNLDWNGLVPANARLTHVRHFTALHTVDRSASSPRREDVALRSERAEYALTKSDILLVLGKDNAIRILCHPFIVRPEITRSDEEPWVELLRVIRYGQAIDLVDMPNLSDQQWSILQDATAAIEMYQRKTISLGRRLCRFLFEDNYPLTDTIYAYGNAGVGETLGALAHLPLTPSAITTAGLFWAFEKWRRQSPQQRHG